MKLACLVLALLMLCGVAVAEDKDTLVWAMSADPASLDPMNTASMNTFTITYALYDCLTISDGNGGYKPYLADDVVMSDDGLTYTVTFTKDVSFHDGLFEGVFIRTPKSPVDLPNILSGLLLFPEQENKDVIRVKSSKFTVTAEEEIPWVLDGEFGGSVTEARIENVKEAVTLSCSPEPEKREEKTEE